MKALDKQIGGLTDEEGSMKVMGFEKCTAMDEYLNNKPCETEDVWQKTYVEVMNVVLVNGENMSSGRQSVPFRQSHSAVFDDHYCYEKREEKSMNHVRTCTIAHFVSASMQDFEEVCAKLENTGFTHVIVSDVPRSRWMMDEDPGNPYVNWSMGQCPLFKLVCPEELKGFFSPAHLEDIRSCHDYVLKKAEIVKAHHMLPAVISNEPFWLPEAVFRAHPAWRGARCDHPRRSTHPFFSPNLDNPEVLSMYRHAASVLRDEMGIDVLHFRTNDCGGGIDWSTGLYTGPNGALKGRGRNIGERVKGFLDAVQMPGMVVSLETDIALKAPETLIGMSWHLLGENQILNKRDREGHMVFMNTYNLAFGRQSVRFVPAPLTLLENLKNLKASPASVKIVEIPRSDMDEGIRIWKEAQNRSLNSMADCYRILEETGKAMFGDKAPLFVDACHFMHESGKHAAHTGVNLVIQGCLHQRWINRPFVLDPKTLMDEEKAYWRPFLFQAQSEEEAEDLMNLQGIEVIRGFTASFLAVQSLQMARNALKNAVATYGKLGTPEADMTVRRLKVLDCFYANAQNAIRFQELKDRTDLTVDPNTLRSLRWPTSSDARAAEFQDICRAEIDNCYELTDLLGEDIHELLLCTDKNKEDIFLLSDQLPEQLRRKAEIMLDHMNDSRLYYTTNNI